MCYSVTHLSCKCARPYFKMKKIFVFLFHCWFSQSSKYLSKVRLVFYDRSYISIYFNRYLRRIHCPLMELPESVILHTETGFKRSVLSKCEPHSSIRNWISYLDDPILPNFKALKNVFITFCLKQ